MQGKICEKEKAKKRGKLQRKQNLTISKHSI
jgi:hypothetical protein